MKKLKFYWFWSLCLPIQWLIIQLLSQYPHFVENYYSTGIYVFISQSVRFLFGWVPFSIGDVLYLTAIYFILKSIVKIIGHRKVRIVKTIGIFSVVYFAFNFLWGINYLRLPIDQSFKFEDTQYTTGQLDLFANKLVQKINGIQLKLTQNDTVPVEIPYKKNEVYKKIKIGYDHLEKFIPSLHYKYQSSKNSIISLPLSYMGFSGYLNPFTGEAQVNSQIPLTSFPATSCHEVAHQLGYAAENEANFIGFLAATHNDDLYFQYSGYLLALRYVLNNLYNHDKGKYKDLVKTINRGILKNMRRTQQHWAKYQNPLEPIFKMIFDQYLKANKQEAGVKSYSLLLGHLIKYEKQNHFLN
jgi:hypothetical protein